MGPDILGIWWLIITCLGTLVMIVFLRKYQNEEKLAMIEKGMNPQENQTPKIASMGALRFGLLVVGGGFGLLVGNFLSQLGMKEPVAYFSMLLIFGGIGLIASYIIEQRRIKKLDNRSE